MVRLGVNGNRIVAVGKAVGIGTEEIQTVKLALYRGIAWVVYG